LPRRWFAASAFVLGMLTMASVLVGLGTTSPASADQTGWTPLPAPSWGSVKALSNEALSCTSSTFCMAVGPTSSALPPPLPFSEVWNGSSWSGAGLPTPTGTPEPTSVSCLSGSFCMAVGLAGSTIFADDWNGSSWSALTIPTPTDGSATFLTSVSCSSTTDCVAVGVDNDAPLVESWDGSAWSIVANQAPPGSPSELDSVSCLSSNDCWAVGDQAGDALSEHFDGSQWSSVPSPAPDGSAALNSISCVSATTCQAVGIDWPSAGGSTPLIETWDGSSWTDAASSLASSPGLSDGLNSVDCVDASTCIAVGTNPLVADLNKGTWQQAPAPAAPSGLVDGLETVSCVPGSSCIVGGFVRTPTTQAFFAAAPLAPPGPPSATITTPPPGNTYAAGQVVPTSFSCTEGLFGSGLDGCTDSNGSSGPGQLDTSSIGVQSYSVTATSTDGQSSTSSLAYSVADLPSASIASPPADEIFGVNQVVPTMFSCADGAGGPGIALCLDQANSTSPSVLPTTTPGTYFYTVGARSLDGLSGSASIAYTVASAPSVASISVGGTYLPHQVVPTTFSCSEGSFGPGLSNCVDSEGSTSPGLLDTSMTGAHTYAVTATSGDGQSTTRSVPYLVADPPVATIATPSAGATYTVGQVVATNFSCVDGPGGTGVSSCLDSNASSSPGTLDTSTLGAHTYAVTATSEDGFESTASVSYSVVRAPTTTTLSASPDPAVGGTKVTYTARVSPNPGSGSVAFRDGARLIPGCARVAVKDTTGKAKCSITYDAAGTHSVVASFSGDDDSAPSSSAPVTESVTQTSTMTTLSSSADPIAVDQSVTYTAQVAPVPNDGAVAFTNGGRAIAGCGAIRVNTSTGKARCSTSYSRAGSHSIVATYGGAPAFQGSASSKLTETVS
jgi:hypothetical protein